MDPSYEPEDRELRTLFGLKLEQKRNNARITSDLFTNIVSKNKDVSQDNYPCFNNNSNKAFI